MINSLQVIGTYNQPFISFPVLSQSSNGIDWDLPTNIFQLYTTPTALCYGDNLLVVTSSIGDITVTSDLINFSNSVVVNGLGIAGINYFENKWIVIGNQLYSTDYGPYPSNSEIAQIFSTNNPADIWSMIWSHETANSRFYQIKVFQNAPITADISADVWIICGVADNIGDAWYSLDNGTTWTRVSIPQKIGTIFSVELVTGYENPSWYWGCDGSIFISDTLSENNWNQLSLKPEDVAVDIVSDSTGTILVAGINSVYSILNKTNISLWSYNGYVFDNVSVINILGKSRWLAFSRSLLTQYTVWYSDDLINWIPNNNNITVSGHTVTS